MNSVINIASWTVSVGQLLAYLCKGLVCGLARVLCGLIMANKKDERMVRFMLDAIAAKDPFANTVLAVHITVLFVCWCSCIAG